MTDEVIRGCQSATRVVRVGRSWNERGVEMANTSDAETQTFCIPATGAHSASIGTLYCIIFVPGSTPESSLITCVRATAGAAKSTGEWGTKIASKRRKNARHKRVCIDARK